ncbi:MAG: glutamine amidotransferase HisH [Bacteroidota bacterium]|jgi:glutamine amidotransferase
MTLIFDYDIGNVMSIANMLKKIGETDIRISAEKDDIENAKRIILPGVGNFDHGMRKLISTGKLENLKQVVYEKQIPILGICLGAQLLCNSSEEGEVNGLGWIDAEVVRFKFDENNKFPIPNMGWCETEIVKQNEITKDLFEPRFYYVHSYHIKCNNPDNVVMESNYGYNFTSAISRDNIYGVQFHPEKSHNFGLTLLRNFCNISNEKI